jgi:hypothetical protein
MGLDKLITFSFAISIVLMTSIAYGADAKPSDFQLKPESLLQEIKSKGAGAVVFKLYDDSNTWNYILKKIATGDRSWLGIAVALHPGSDAGSSEMLTLAVGEALEHNPLNVFQIAPKDYQLSFICSGPDVDDNRYDSYELSMKAINLRIKKVAAIKEPSLMNMSKECISFLEESKKGIAQFYEVDKK